MAEKPRAPKGAPENPKKGDTYTGPKGAIYTWTGKRWNRTGTQSTVDWLEDASRQYGWIASLYETDDSIRGLLDFARKNIDPRTSEGQQRFLTELYKTAWWNNTSVSMRQYQQLKSSPEWNNTLAVQTDKIRGYANNLGVQLSDATMAMLAEDSIKNGWQTDLQFERAVGSQYLAETQKAQAAAQPVDAQMDITTSTQFAQVKKIAADLLLDNIPDTELQTFASDMITGGSTLEAVKRELKARAKLRYGSLSDYIDQDYNLRSVTNDYRQVAAQLLEKPESEIDFTKDTYAAAFNMADPATGKTRQMNLNEWSKYVRGLPDWQQTQNAQDAYRNMAMSIVRGFGKVV